MRRLSELVKTGTINKHGSNTAALKINEPEYPKAAKLIGAILLPIRVERLDSPM